jgi:hypothetical protein
MHPLIVRIPPVAAVVLVLVATGCGKKDPADEMTKAAAEIEKAAPASPAEEGVLPPAEQVKEAISEFKAGKMEDAVTRLQLLRSKSQMTPEQRMALQDSMATLMTEIYTMAEKGDARAIAAVAQYERMQTGR